MAQVIPFVTENVDSAGSSSYRPTNDLKEFNNLLPPPIEFVEGSSNGTLALPEGKYAPINSGSQPHTNGIQLNGKTSLSKQSRPNQVSLKDLYPNSIDITFPENLKNSVGKGLGNMGNTCFLNSAVQCLIHTPPLLRLLLEHLTCSLKSKSDFCMTCSLKALVIKTFNDRNYFTPIHIVHNLQAIAKHMKRGRQEDSHEFLRYAIDAVQKSCLLNANVSLKIDPKIAHTTWIHKIYGGQLRSRVHCKSCGHNSDTYDSILDLSLDIHNCTSLEDAFKRFVAPDHLKGDDKYKCEKCKKHVNADKRFTINAAPVALTIQLKRFTPFGKKITHPVQYRPQISLRPYMSEGEFGPTYSLYGIVCHTGGGPNSGHYTSIVKGRDARWYELDDDESYPCSSALSKKSAYILFYLRTDPDETKPTAPPIRRFVNAPVKKEEDRQTPKRPFIGPQIPASLQKNPLDTITAGRNLKSKIDAVANNATTTKPSAPKPSLVPDYGSDGESSPPLDMPPPSSSPQKSSILQPTPPKTPTTSASNGISPASFYGSSNGKKRKFEESTPSSSPSISTKLARGGGNPYSQFSSGNKMAQRKQMRIHPT